jgi:hypothetical protein
MLLFLNMTKTKQKTINDVTINQAYIEDKFRNVYRFQPLGPNMRNRIHSLDVPTLNV